MDLTIEQTILLKLHELQSSSDDLKGQVRDMRTIMMGDGKGETPFGRLPMVEKRLDKACDQISALETAHAESKAVNAAYAKMARGAAGVGGFLAGLIGAAATLLTNFLFHAR